MPSFDASSEPARLTVPISDRVRAWSAGDIDAADLDVALDDDAAGELAAAGLRDPASVGADDAPPALPRLSAFARRVARARLVDGCGAFVVRGAAWAALPSGARAGSAFALLRCLGEPLPQNDDGDRFVRVRDEGQRLAAGGRYHKSNEGGELHTDGPQFDAPPAIMGLYCVHPAEDGGESLLVNGLAVHNALLVEQPALLPALYQPFYFHKKPGARTTRAPIFAFDAGSGALSVRYLGDYVRSGHAVADAPLNDDARAALDALDRLLADERRFALRFTLQEGDLLVVDNRRILHGRTGFRDGVDGAPPREMGRVWIQGPVLS